jgi:hypothetical protein
LTTRIEIKGGKKKDPVPFMLVTDNTIWNQLGYLKIKDPIARFANARGSHGAGADDYPV